MTPRMDGTKDLWLNELRRLVEAKLDQAALREHGIRRAREAGASDSEIGKALGITKQAVAKAVPHG